jgi:hypothetical protein
MGLRPLSLLLSCQPICCFTVDSLMDVFLDFALPTLHLLPVAPLYPRPRRPCVTMLPSLADKMDCLETLGRLVQKGKDTVERLVGAP